MMLPVVTRWMNRAVYHGEMAVYHLRNHATTEFEHEWNEGQAVAEAGDAWHFASLIGDSEAAIAELKRREAEAAANEILF